MRRAFTLIELIVAMGILAMMLSFASVIFKVSIDSHRTAIANAEIMQKLRTITDQIDADLKGLCKDDEIFVIWSAEYDSDLGRYVRFDRIVFFCSGDFQSYGTSPMVRGNVARICYILAKNAEGKRANEFTDLSATVQGLQQRQQERRERILARTQHILTAETAPEFVDFLSPVTTTRSNEEWFQWNNVREYEITSLEGWKYIPWDEHMLTSEPNAPLKRNILSVITDIVIKDDSADHGPVSARVRGATVDKRDPDSLHMLLCEGVGEFKIQGWYDVEQRWVPEVDPNGDGSLADSDFWLDSSGERLDPETVPGVLYPYPPYGGVGIRGINYDPNKVDQAHFDAIPGLGRALKFTFTLYDSKGIIEGGRTFTHIVYLGD
jgi:prepilin-type N-terminal cleavage/methylation domain-containing protein